MKKRIISIVLALALCFALCSSAFALTFTDLNDHWAKTYMEDLATRKYLSGYEDGTIRPDASITVVETLALLSRFYSPSADELELITEDYESIVKSRVPSTVQWAYDEVELCLAAGIVKESELSMLSYSKPIQKQLLAQFLVRAIQKQSEAEALTTSTETCFADAADIAADCYGSVIELYKLGIVKGDDQNNFLPKSETARGVVAAMVSRSLDYLKNNGTVLAIKNYAGLSRSYGVITYADSGSIQLRAYDGLVREYKFTAAAAVTVNGAAKTLSSVYVGCGANISVKNGAVSAISVTDSTTDKLCQGVVYSVSSSGNAGFIYLTDSYTGKSVQYTVPSNASVSLDGMDVYFSSVSRKDFVTIESKYSVVTKITAVSADKDIKGEITEIKFGTTVSFKLMDSNGVTYCFSFDIDSPPKITRGSTTINVDKISVGSKVTVSIEDFLLKAINTEGSETSVTGELTSITSTASSTQWVVTVNGKPITLTLDKNVAVYSGKTSILLSDIHAGDTVTIYYFGSLITEVHLVNATNSSSKLSGSVLATSTTGYTVTVLSSSEKIVYANLSNVNYIIDAETGNALSFSKITEGSQLTVYGSYKDSSNFKATVVVVEVLQ